MVSAQKTVEGNSSCNMIGHIHTVSALVIRRREPSALLVAIYASPRRHGGEDRHIFVFVDCLRLHGLTGADPTLGPAIPPCRARILLHLPAHRRDRRHAPLVIRRRGERAARRAFPALAGQRTTHMLRHAAPAHLQGVDGSPDGHSADKRRASGTCSADSREHIRPRAAM